MCIYIYIYNLTGGGHGGSYWYLQTWTAPLRFHKSLQCALTVGRRRLVLQPLSLPRFEAFAALRCDLRC